MNHRHRARRLVALATCVGTTAALAALGGAPAAFATAEDTCTTAYGSGSSLQKEAQKKDFLSHFAGTYTISGVTSGCTSTPSITYTSSSSGQGLNEFGDTTGVISKKEDSPAHADTTSPCTESGPEPEKAKKEGGCLDGYVGTDVPPTAGELGEARVAAGAL